MDGACPQVRLARAACEDVEAGLDGQGLGAQWMLAQSALRFVGHFVAPGAAVFHAERSAIAAVMGAPMHSMGAGIVGHFCAACARKELGSIDLLSRASRIKLVTTNFLIQGFLAQIMRMSELEDIVPVPRPAAWRRGIPVAAVKDAYRLCISLP